MEQHFYDVCNDYSLEKREKPSDLHLYVSRSLKVRGQSTTAYFHKKYNELHYISSDKPVIAKFIEG